MTCTAAAHRNLFSPNLCLFRQFFSSFTFFFSIVYRFLFFRLLLNFLRLPDAAVFAYTPPPPSPNIFVRVFSTILKVFLSSFVCPFVVVFLSFCLLPSFFFFLGKLSIEEYLMRSPHKKLLYNPLAAEFGIENMAQMNNFIRNEMPLFKMVRSTRTGLCRPAGHFAVARVPVG